MTDVELEESGGAPAGPDLLHGAPVTSSRGQVVLHPHRDGYLELMRTLADEGYAMCVDLCAVDYLEHPGARCPTV